MRDIFANQSKESRWLLAVPFAVVLAVFLIEIETPGLRVTPSLLTIALTIFALFLSPRAVFWWAVALFIPVVLTLWLVPNGGVRESAALVALRSLAFVAVACVAVGLSRYRWDSEQQLQGLLALFDALQTPVVVSDIDGNINFVNRACCELLGRNAAEVRDASFFSLFSQPDRRGQAIESYLAFFDNDPGRSESITVNVQGGAGTILRTARCFTMKWEKQKLLVTQLC